MTHYEMAEKLSEKMNVTLEEATAALEACDWEMLDAALKLEKEHGAAQGQPYTTKTAAEDDGEDVQDARERGGRAIHSLGELLRSAVNIGLRNRFEVRRNDALIVEVPVIALVLLLVFAFWVCIPLLVIGLFAGFQYSFTGDELGRDSVNNAMNKAAEVAQTVKEEVTRER